MADLGTLRPSGIVADVAGWTGWQDGKTDASLIGDASDSTWNGVSVNATDLYVRAFELPDMPSDFVSMTTLSVNARWAWSATASNTNWVRVGVRVRDSGGVLIAHNIGFSNPSDDLSFQPLQSGAITTTTPTNGINPSFGFLNTTADKATWDGAVCDVLITRTRSKGGDSAEQRIFDVWFTGTYVQGSVFTPVDPFGMSGFFGS